MPIQLQVSKIILLISIGSGEGFHAPVVHCLHAAAYNTIISSTVTAAF